MHTNDAFVICESPTLGGSAADPIEVSGPPKGWFSTNDNILHSGSNCSGSEKNFKGTLTANSAVLTPPPTNGELQTIAEPQFRYKGQTRICLSGESMTVMTLTASGTCAAPKSVLYSGSIPANGVVYDESGTCPSAYTPFDVSYAITEPPSECGNVYLEGSYTGQLTIAAANDIVITGNVCLESCSNEPPMKGEGVLGLVANNFVRIYHPEPYHVEKIEKERESRRRKTGLRMQKRDGVPPERHHPRGDPGDRALLHRRQLQMRRQARHAEGQWRDRAEVPRRRRHRRRQRHRLPEELQLRQPPPLHRATELHRARKNRLGDRPGDARIAASNFYFLVGQGKGSTAIRSMQDRGGAASSPLP